jgi:hypothetical protein
MNDETRADLSVEQRLQRLEARLDELLVRFGALEIELMGVAGIANAGMLLAFALRKLLAGCGIAALESCLSQAAVKAAERDIATWLEAEAAFDAGLGPWKAALDALLRRDVAEPSGGSDTAPPDTAPGGEPPAA